MKEGGWDVSFRLVGLYLKSTNQNKLFTISKTWLTMGGVVSPGSTGPQMSKHQNTENKRHDECMKTSWPDQSTRPGS